MSKREVSSNAASLAPRSISAVLGIPMALPEVHAMRREQRVLIQNVVRSILERHDPVQSSRTLVGTVRAILDNSFKDPRSLSRSLNAVRTSDEIVLTAKALIKKADGMKVERFEPLFDYLGSIDGVLKGVETASAGSALSRVQETRLMDSFRKTAGEGKLQEHFGRHPEVEEWASKMAEEIFALIESALERGKATTRRIAEVILMTAAGVCGVFNAAEEYFRTSRQRVQEYSYMGGAIDGVRQAVLYLIMKKIADVSGDDFVNGYVEADAALSGRAFHERYVPPDSPFNLTRLHVEMIRKVQSNLSNAAETLAWREELPRLASILQEMGFASQEKEERETPRVMPWGLVTIVDVRGGRTVFHTSDAVQGVSSLAVTDDDAKAHDHDAMYLSLVPEDTDNVYAARGVLSSYIDETGRPFVTLRVDNLISPDPALNETASVLQSADRHFNQQLCALWERFPELFSMLADIGPYIFVRKDGQEILLCRSSISNEVGRILKATPIASDVTALMKECCLKADGEWTGFRIANAAKQVEDMPSADHIEEPLGQRNVWRRSIQAELGGGHRVPNFDWIIKHLERLGAVWQVAGKGTTHGTLFFQRDGKTHRYTITPKWSGRNQTLPPFILYDVLATLGISEQEFCETCLAQEEHAEVA